MQNRIKCIIVDDEPMALALLESYVLKTPFLELVQKCSNAFEALQVLNSQSIDLLFLDIQMPELSGIELAKTIPVTTRIIFTTAFNEYAIDGFRAKALDYLMKPFGFDQFYNAALRAKEWCDLVDNQSEKVVSPPDSFSHPQNEELSFIFVKSEYRQLKIVLDDIVYIEGLKDYIKIWLRSEERPILTLMSLKSLENELPTAKFMRIHRSFIIALEAIDFVERHQVIIKKQRITVAEQYRTAFQEYIQSKSITR